MYTEDEFVMISALQHYIFCPRQCALIHIEDVWQDNLLTVRGEILHEKADSDTYETRGDIRTVCGLRIHSYEYGLTGRCDVVEFRITPAGREVFPVEFKAGEPKSDLSDSVQICAQALSLEEMFGVSIKQGAFFYGKIRRRVPIEFTEELRKSTVEVIRGVRDLINNQTVPTARYASKCRSCSLIDICQPKAMDSAKLKNYISELFS